MKPEFPRRLTASITGIDGAGKSTVSELVTETLSKDVQIAKLSRPVYSVKGGVKTAEYTKCMAVVDRIHEFADKRENRQLSLAANALDVILQGRVIEPGLRKKVNPDIVLGTRDYLIDPSVYSIFYAGFLGKKPPEERLEVFQKITGSRVRDIVFFLTVPPNEAVERIEKRMAEEREKSENVMREKWRHIHEQPHYLDQLQQEYYSVLKVVPQKGPVKIYEIDTTTKNKEQVADYISLTLREHLRKISKFSLPIPKTA